MKNTCNQCIFGPAAEPVHGATRDQRRKLQRSVPELLPNRGKAQNDVEIMSNSGHEVIVQVSVGWRSPGKLSLHDRDEIIEDIIYFVTGKQVGHLKAETCSYVSDITILTDLTIVRSFNTFLNFGCRLLQLMAAAFFSCIQQLPGPGILLLTGGCDELMELRCVSSSPAAIPKPHPATIHVPVLLCILKLKHFYSDNSANQIFYRVIFQSDLIKDFPYRDLAVAAFKCSD